MNLQQLETQPHASGSSDNVSADTPLSKIVFVAFDTETTGLSANSDRLVELCGVKFVASGEDISVFHTLIDPQIRIPSAVTRIHGITDDMVQGMPPFEKAVPQFIDWALDSEPGHNLSKASHHETVWLA